MPLTPTICGWLRDWLPQRVLRASRMMHVVDHWQHGARIGSDTATPGVGTATTVSRKSGSRRS